MPGSAYDELIARSRDATTLGSCAAVLGWDERTYMPTAGAIHRGAQMAMLARIGHEMATDPRVGELLGKLESSTLDGGEAANVREIRRNYNRAAKLPKALVEELARITTEAQSVWQDAKTTSNFALFQPWLEKIVALKRREAECVGYSTVPYDALLDEFEPGATAGSIRSLFKELADELAPLVARISAKMPPPTDALMNREFSITAQETLCREVAVAVGYDFKGGRLDTTSHPFCTGIGPGDCRILTRYNPRRPFDSFFGTLHEAGHGLYEQGLDPAHYGTSLGQAASFGIHESQSRLWENQIGRSRGFWGHYAPKFRAAFALDGISDEQLWLAANQVRPSLVRVDADEVTYNLHIILRFELEVALMDGTLAVADLPAAWNERFRKLFGIAVPDHGRGCLQDIHWSFGGFGYFPTYTLGNLFAAQFMEAADRDLPGFDVDVRRGNFGRLTTWLRENIHRHGQRYRPAELCERITGRPLTHRPFVDYLKHKFAAWLG